MGDMDRLYHGINSIQNLEKKSHEFIPCSFSTNVLRVQTKNAVYSIIDFG